MLKQNCVMVICTVHVYTMVAMEAWNVSFGPQLALIGLPEVPPAGNLWLVIAFHYRHTVALS